MAAFQDLRAQVSDYVTEERAAHIIGHLQEAGKAVDFPTVVNGFQRDILKEADPDHRVAFEGNPKDFRRIVGQLVGQDRDCKRLIFAAMKAESS